MERSLGLSLLHLQKCRSQRTKLNEIEAVLSLVDPHFIKLDPASSTVFLEKKGMKLDLGCLAKGYSTDKVAQYLKVHGVTSALINLGGNILTIGNNQAKEGKDWQDRKAHV